MTQTYNAPESSTSGAHEQAGQPGEIVLPLRRCASLTLAGEACRAYPAQDGWPWCSSHRYLHTRTAA